MRDGDAKQPTARLRGGELKTRSRRSAIECRRPSIRERDQRSRIARARTRIPRLPHERRRAPSAQRHVVPRRPKACTCGDRAPRAMPSHPAVSVQAKRGTETAAARRPSMGLRAASIGRFVRLDAGRNGDENRRKPHQRHGKAPGQAPGRAPSARPTRRRPLRRGQPRARAPSESLNQPNQPKGEAM